MASLSKLPDGRRRLQFMDASGDRRTVYLGKMDLRHAEAIRVRVEALLTATLAGSSPDAETAKWMGTLNPKLHAKLAKAGLFAPREATRTTIGQLLETFFSTVNVKSSTLTTYMQTRRSLEESFSPPTPLKSITALDADKWRQVLKKSGLAEATISKRVKVARQIFKSGIKWKMIAENPFAEVRAGVQTNRSRMFFITREVAAKVLDACPNAEWRCIFALSRFGGLRCPSEHLALRWCDVDWVKGLITVWSPKTEGHEGREFRLVPLFPELRVVLQEAYDLAEPGTEHIITRYRLPSCNLRTEFHRILARAGVAPWEKVFHNLRSSRQTELTERYPTHVVCAWLGNSPTVAHNHYLQVRDAHFADAIAEVAASKTTQNTTQHAAATPGTAMQPHLGQVA